MSKKIIIPLLLILFMASMMAFGAPVYINVGPTTEFDGDIKILSEIVAEGTTADGWETTVFFTDPTADRTITIPDADVTIGIVTGIVPPDHGGTGIANNVASTITITGNFATTITISNVTAITLPTSGIVVSDNNACTDIEGIGLSIAGGVLNWACTVNGIDSDNYTDGSIDHEHLAADVISGMTDVTSADADYILIWDTTDSLLKKCDMGEVRGAAGGATTALDNLAAVQINTSLLSDAADTDSLGTIAAEWLNLYIGDAGKIYCGLAQDISIHRSAAGVMTLTAANGVVTSAALTVSGALGIGANNLTLTGYVGRDADNFLGFDVDNTLKIEINNILHSIVSISDGAGNNDKLVTQGYVDDAVAGGGANVALSNLAVVAINASLISDTADAYDLGSATFEWLSLYLGTYGTVYFGVGQTENIAETAVNELTITSTTVAIAGILVMGANNITTTGYIGRDADNFLDWTVDNSLTIEIGGVQHDIVSISGGVGDNDKLVTQGYVDDVIGGASLALDNLVAVQINTTLLSDTADTDDLGTAAAEWRSLYIGTAGKIYMGLSQEIALEVTDANTLYITASANVSLSGGLIVAGTVALAANNLTMTGSIAATANRVTKVWTVDIESTNAPTIGGDQINSGDLSDVASIAMLDENESITGNWDSTGTLDLARTNTIAGGDHGFQSHIKQETNALTGTLWGAYITASNNQAAECTGTIRGLEVKARTKYPAGTGGTVAVLEGVSISADSKDQSVTTMRGIEVMLDGSTGGTVTEGVGIRIANNMQADKITTMTALQIYSDSFAYDYGIDMSQGAGGITTDIKLSGGITITDTASGIAFSDDIFTDRWLSQERNTFFGVSVAGSGNLAHTVGNTGWDNVGFGYEALLDITTGEENGAIGYRAGYNITTGYRNMCFGAMALTACTTGWGNLAIGRSSLASTNGNGNVAIGTESGKVTTGSSNVFIGHTAGYGQDASNQLFIENSSSATPLIYGEFDNDLVRIYGKFSATISYQMVVTMDDSDATPTVAAGNVFISQANTNPTEITDLDNPTVGQTVTIIVGNAGNPPTITDGGNFALSAGWNPDLNDTITLFIQADNDYIELNRSTN